MPTSEAVLAPAAPTEKLLDARFAKKLVIVNGLVPAALLIWDGVRHQLGVNEVNFAIRTTGLVGLVLLVLTLAITPLRKLTGWTWLISIRRNLGVYACLYIAAHFAIFFWFDRDASLGSTLEEILERVYLWFGFGALVLMIPLAITSTDGMVTRLGAKRWKLLHRLAYLAAIGGVVHYYLLVKSDIRQPLAFAVVATALLLYRAVRHYVDLRIEVRTAKTKMMASRQAMPARKKFWSGELRVARIFDETPDVKTFRMVAADGGPLPFEHISGQYLNLALVIDGKRVNRSYTIASSPTRAHYCEISVKRAANGYASAHLHATLREGSILKVSAPAGKFFYVGTESKRVVLIAGGVGITPMMSIVRSLTDRCWPGDIYLIFSVKKLHDLIFKHELDYLQTRFPNLHVCITLTSDPDLEGWTGPRGKLSKEIITTVIPNLTSGPVLLCGPDPMMDAARKLLVELGVPNAEISQEAFVSPPAIVETGATEAIAVPVAAVSEGAVPSVRFQRTGKTSELPADLTVLEAAEECGVSIPFECRSGICGQCKTKLVSGRVTMEVQDALTSADRSKGLILTCQARPVGDVVVDA